MDLAAVRGMTSPILLRRTAGQSVRDQKEKLTDNRLVPCCLALGTVWGLWMFEELKSLTHQPPDPSAVLCVAVVVTGIVAIILRRLFPKFRNLNRGERGEMRVAEVLDDLRRIDYQPFHAIKRTGFDIDHVVVGPGGVFAVETKFRSGHGEIEFRNGEGLFIGGFQEEKDVLKQARANAREVNQIIQENCGIYQWVKPLVVFVGDWQIKDRWLNTDARVLTTGQLVRFFEIQQPVLTRSEIKLIASHLERSVRH
jgi:hypothetical protein